MLPKVNKFIDRFVNGFRSNKVPKYLALAIFGSQMFLSTLSFAQSDLDLPCYDDYYDKSLSFESFGIDSTENNAASSTNTKIVSTGLIFLGGVAPEVGCEYESASAEFKQVGLLTMVDRLNSEAMSNPPSVNLVAHLSEEWVPGQKNSDSAVYADGYEFLQSQNMTDLWERTRVISYILFVIVMIISGFMIMFRQKIGGQVMITLFNTIPNVIVGLILVTFSFSIVGLIMDIGALLIVISGSILGVGDAELVVTNPLSLMKFAFQGTDGLNELTASGGAAGAAGVAAFLISASPLGIIGGIVGFIGLLIALVVCGIVMYASVKVYITLLKAYIGILIDTIFAPILLTIAVIPGRSGTGWDWFNRVLKNVLTFVGVFFIVNLALVLFNSDIQFAFPANLASGNLDQANGSFGVLNVLLKGIIPLYLFFLASEVPAFLDDFLPSSGGKGAAGAFQNTQKNLSSLPVLGSIFG